MHGITLQSIVEHLHKHYGWEALGELININCFKENPSVKSSLTFCAKPNGAEKSGRFVLEIVGQ
ncbi:MAG: DUF2132 domain-containing protein [Bacteroidetes bacterium]|nr:DUF2132 domain-containing protein [Bacteroidota bacterium]